MRLLLEFKDYNDLSFIKDTIEDVILSEIEESIDPKVHRSIINISDGVITCHDIKRGEYSSDLEFVSYLVAFNGRIEKNVFENISGRVESILSLEFDEKIKCTALQFFPINEFVICNEKDFYKLQSIIDFENAIEDEIYEIKDNQYTSVIDLTTDDFDNKMSLTIWLREYSSKFGINLKLNRENIESSCLKYKLSTELFFNSARDLPNRWIQIVHLDKPKGKHASDINIEDWIKRNLHPVNWDILKKLGEIEQKINSLNLSFDLDLNDDSNSEAERLINMIRTKIFTILSTDETDKISNLYEQFRKLKESNIEAEWAHRGNYFYLFDINYKGNNYIINVKYNIKKDLVKIDMLHPNIISEEVEIKEFYNTIYLLLQEN